MNPLNIQQYGANKNTFTAFTKRESKFVGWLKLVNELWYVTPSNGWAVKTFPTKAKAVRYLISSITKTTK